MKFITKIAFLLVMLFLIIGCNNKSQISVVTYSTGLIGANCYLVYDNFTKEAALIDVGGPIDSILNIIAEKKLDLKYFLITHGHQDHVAGIPEIRKPFPNAKLCMSKQEFDDLELYADFELSFPKYAEEWKKDAIMMKLLGFNYADLGTPDIFLDSNSSLNLGSFDFQIIETPGHSRGSISVYIDNAIFTGDLLLRGSVGLLDYKLASRMDLINSVYNLYNSIPESTFVYPGHRQSTTIKIEKYNNKDISTNKLNI